MTQTVRVGGVPEHFNLPWHLAIEDGCFATIDPDVEVVWLDFPGGTGEIMQALETGLVDIATPLTEGVVTAIANGNPSELVTSWVDSPLHWGVFAAAESPAETVSELRGERFAISRYGSGSELMSRVMANEYQWELTNESFVVVGGLSGAVEALPAGNAEIFMWDKAMTQPFVDAGVFKAVGHYPTPWPSFMVAQSTKFGAAFPGLGEQLANVAKVSAQELLSSSVAANVIASRFDLDNTEVSEWLSNVRWAAPGSSLDQNMIDEVADKMSEIGRIPAM